MYLLLLDRNMQRKNNNTIEPYVNVYFRKCIQIQHLKIDSKGKSGFTLYNRLVVQEWKITVCISISKEQFSIIRLP